MKERGKRGEIEMARGRTAEREERGGRKTEYVSWVVC
jgi:hypothetical protein